MVKLEELNVQDAHTRLDLWPEWESACVHRLRSLYKANVEKK